MQSFVIMTGERAGIGGYQRIKRDTSMLLREKRIRNRKHGQAASSEDPARDNEAASTVPTRSIWRLAPHMARLRAVS